MSSLIVALDYSEQNQALHLVDQLDPSQCMLKVGSEMFTKFGASFIKTLMDRNFKIFLDLKFHDIPTTVAKSCMVCADLGVWMINLHASGGASMMSSARKAVEPWGKERPLIIAVTVLTSFSAYDLPSIDVNETLPEHIINLSMLALNSGLDGVVCSAHDVLMIKKMCGQNFLTVTPGIRLVGDNTHDQVRVMTPAQAKLVGSDYFVVGRSITQSPNPALVVSSILEA